MINPKYFEEPMASEFDKMRDKARRNRVLTYDCHNNRLDDKRRVICKKGHKMYKLSVLECLKGRSTSTCQNCKDFD